MEVCLAVHDIIGTCVEGHAMCMDDHAMRECPEHRNGPCPMPGAKVADPYARKQGDRE